MKKDCWKSARDLPQAEGRSVATGPTSSAVSPVLDGSFPPTFGALPRVADDSPFGFLRALPPRVALAVLEQAFFFDV